MEEVLVRVSDYTRFPGGRFSSDGEGNAADFRVKFLVPPLKNGNLVKLNLDGVIGYPASFLEEAFGGLIRNEGFDSEFVEKHIELEALEPGNSGVIRLIQKYIKSPDDLKWMQPSKVA